MHNNFFTKSDKNTTNSDGSIQITKNRRSKFKMMSYLGFIYALRRVGVKRQCSSTEYALTAQRSVPSHVSDHAVKAFHFELG